MADDPYVFRADDELGKIDGGNGEAHAATKPLHSLWSVFFATLFGSVPGGCAVISISLFRLNKARNAWIVLSCGLLFTVVLFAGLWQLPDDVNIPSAVVYAPQLFCMHLVAKQLYGKELEKQQRSGGRIASGWIGTGIGILAVTMILVTALGAFIMIEGIPLAALFEDYGQVLNIGPDTVYYDTGATKQMRWSLQNFCRSGNTSATPELTPESDSKAMSALCHSAFTTLPIWMRPLSTRFSGLLMILPMLVLGRR